MGFPFGLSYARGPYQVEVAVPSSAFSKGDILCFTSASSLSRMPATFGLPIAGVALSASTASYADQVGYVVANNETEFWSRATTGSSFSEGEVLDFEYTGGQFFLTTSQNTRSAAVVKGSGARGWNADNSTVSFVLVRLLSSRTLAAGLAYDNV